MRLLLDNIVFSLQSAGGISVYWSEMLRRMPASGHDFRCLERPEALRNIQRQSLSLTHNLQQSYRAGIPVSVERYLPVTLKDAAGTIFHSSYYRTASDPGAINIVTVHDFVYEKHCSGMRRIVHSTQKRHAIRRAAMIICDSESTRRDLMEFSPDTPRDLVRVVHLAASEEFRHMPESPPVLSAVEAAGCQKFFLYVGDRSRYKNFDTAVAVTAKVNGMSMILVGGGRLSDNDVRILNRNLPGRYLHLTGLPAAEMNILYNTADCLLYPSSYEGFGIPPLEAMRAGCPVLAVASSSIPEVCGDAALLAESPDGEKLLALLSTLNQTDVRQNLRERGFRQASRFSWDRTFSETMECYAEASGCLSNR